MITPWSWTTSNGSATDYQTQRAYAAITSNGLTTSFAKVVWNDLVDKIKEVTDALRRGWQDRYGSYSNTRMSANYPNLTAERMNAAVLNVCYLWWSWALDPEQQGYLGRTEFRGLAQVGDNADFVYGRYFLELTERLNLMIGVINGTGQLSEMEAVGQQVGEFIAEADILGSLEMLTNSITELVSNAALSQKSGVDLRTLDRISSSIRAELELSDLSGGISGFAYQALRFIETLRLVLTAPMDVRERTPLDANADIDNPEVRALNTNEVVHLNGSDAGAAYPTVPVGAVGGAENRNTAELVKAHKKSIKHKESHSLGGEQSLQADEGCSFGWTTLQMMITSQNEMIAVNALLAYMEKNLQMMLELFVSLIKQRSMPLQVYGQTQATETATLIEDEPEAMAGEDGAVSSSSATVITDESKPLSTESIHRESGSGTMNRRKSAPLSGALSFLFMLVGEMDMEYAKVSYLEALNAMTNTIHAAVEIGLSAIADHHEQITLDTIAGLSGFAAVTMDALCLELWTAVADIVTGTAIQAKHFANYYLKLRPTAEAKQITSAKAETHAQSQLDAVAELNRPSFVSAGFEGELRENAGANASESQPFSIDERVSIVTQALLTLRNEILPAYAEVVHHLTIEGTAGVVDVSHGMVAEVLASLGMSADIDHQCYAAIAANLLAAMTPVAYLEYIAAWDYPIQQGTDLLIKQVKHTDHFGDHLYLDVGETVNEMIALMTVIANLDMQYRKDGSIRLINIAVTETGTLSTVSASAWVYPVLKNGNELSIRQVYGAAQTDIKLEVE